MTTLASPLPLDAPPADILPRTAALLRANGLHPAFRRHGVLLREYWPDDHAQPWRPGLRLSLVGAIGVALGLHHAGDVTWHVIPCVLDETEPPHPALAAVMEHLAVTSIQSVWRWADRQPVDRAIDVVRGAAERAAVTCLSCGAAYGQQHASWCEFRACADHHRSLGGAA